MAFASYLIAITLVLNGGTPAATDPELVASIHALAKKDLRVAAIAYRLQTASAARCPVKTRLSGLIVQDISQYRGDLRPAMSALYNLNGAPAVVGVVPGSVGERTGVRAGDQILAIDGADLAAGLAPIEHDKSGKRYTAIIQRLEAAFERGPVILTIRRNGRSTDLTMTGALACASQVQLDLTDACNAQSDGTMITISQGLVDFVQSDDELAYAIGHEISHNILDHRSLLDATRTQRNGLFAGWGANGRRLRNSERQADQLGLSLVASAGYDYHAAAAFWQRVERLDARSRRSSDGTHPADEARIRALQRQAQALDGRRARNDPPTSNPGNVEGGTD